MATRMLIILLYTFIWLLLIISFGLYYVKDSHRLRSLSIEQEPFSQWTASVIRYCRIFIISLKQVQWTLAEVHYLLIWPVRLLQTMPLQKVSSSELACCHGHCVLGRCVFLCGLLGFYDSVLFLDVLSATPRDITKSFVQNRNLHTHLIRTISNTLVWKRRVR